MAVRRTMACYYSLIEKRNKNWIQCSLICWWISCLLADLIGTLPTSSLAHSLMKRNSWWMPLKWWSPWQGSWVPRSSCWGFHCSRTSNYGYSLNRMKIVTQSSYFNLKRSRKAVHLLPSLLPHLQLLWFCFFNPLSSTFHPSLCFAQ